MLPDRLKVVGEALEAAPVLCVLPDVQVQRVESVNAQVWISTSIWSSKQRIELQRWAMSCRA
ncbi:hypothetical protein [Conexibacter sp. S30A1]|uniref:hypothetical protein n=1 Tax=Conexibacter sp. S30A1 TaxID=2937800 RepID=UPI00200D5A89|nr:hypothetical protein [Conexibacter sp. S30A1]